MKLPQKNPKGSVGIDIAEVDRFKSMLGKSKEYLLQKFFSEAEIRYGNSYADPAIHLAGTFAAKEAASKALGPYAFPAIALEIRRAEDGAPAVFHKNRRLSVKISITHTKQIAAAIAVV